MNKKHNDTLANRLLYAEDCKHSETPGIYWQCKIPNCGDSWGDFRGHESPGWLDNIDYRRKPDAPVWRKPVDITGRLTKYMRPKSKLAHIKRGDRVVCGPNRLRRYFAHESNGLAFCFTVGDEWISNGAVTQWRFCELWDGKNG